MTRNRQRLAVHDRCHPTDSNWSQNEGQLRHGCAHITKGLLPDAPSYLFANSPEMNAHAEKVMGSQLHHSYVAVQYRAGAWLWTTEGPATIKQETQVYTALCSGRLQPEGDSVVRGAPGPQKPHATAFRQIIAAKAIELMESRPGLRVFVASDLFATRPLDMFMAIKIRERLGWTARALRDYKNKVSTVLPRTPLGTSPVLCLPVVFDNRHMRVPAHVPSPW